MVAPEVQSCAAAWVDVCGDAVAAARGGRGWRAAWRCAGAGKSGTGGWRWDGLEAALCVDG